jgi:addiction module RelE/StbE family toxin
VLSVSWKTDALYDLVEIVDYVEQRNPVAAANLHADIVSVAESLPNHPYLYRRGRVPGTREAVVHPNYILVYLVGENVIEILHVIHSRQQFPF